MKLPQFIRKLVPLAIVLFVLSCIGTFGFLMLPSQWTWLSAASVVVAIVSFGTFMFGAPLVRIIENAYLRAFGQPATAIVLESYDITSGNGRKRTYGGTRYKLAVSLPGGGSFEGVAEDGVQDGLEQGGSFPVKYDSLTKDVVRIVSKAPKGKYKPDF
jgi:hypothetical protein